MQFFGYDLSLKRIDDEIDDKDDRGRIEIEPDGSKIVTSEASRSSLVSFDDLRANSAKELIENYRRISHYPEVSTAVDEVVNEIVVIDEENDPVTLNVDHIVEEKLITKKIGDRLKELHEQIIEDLQFKKKGYQIIREWYVDSKLSFVLELSGNDGEPDSKPSIERLTQLNPTNLVRVKIVESRKSLFNIKEDFYIYMRGSVSDNSRVSGMTRPSISMTHNQFDSVFKQEKYFKINPTSVVSVGSGLIDKTSGIEYGYLHKAVKVANQLDLIESSLIVHRLSRAEDKRVIYVDTGNLSPNKAQQKVENVKRQMRRETGYDTVRGSITTKNRVMALGEDLFIGRSGGQKTAEIGDLNRSDNLGNFDDVDRFTSKLYASLDVPKSRFNDSASIFTQNSEITREELRFNKYVTRVRSQFTNLFIELLRRYVHFNNVMSTEEFNEIAHKIRYNYNKDLFFAELKEMEIMSMRINTASEFEPMVGKYYSHDYIRREILKQTDDVIDKQDEMIKKEKSEKKDQYSDPEENFDSH